MNAHNLVPLTNRSHNTNMSTIQIQYNFTLFNQIKMNAHNLVHYLLKCIWLGWNPSLVSRVNKETIHFVSWNKTRYSKLNNLRPDSIHNRSSIIFELLLINTRKAR